jgi:Na+/melibiose symporter-like transporter
MAQGGVTQDTMAQDVAAFSSMAGAAVQTSESKDAAAYYRNQIAAYTDTIRISDFKANVAVVYGAFTIGPVLGFADKFPRFLPLAAVLLPFVVVFFCLLVCLFPRYPRRGRANFLIKPNASPEEFRSPVNHAVTLEQQQLLCVILCNILYWKTVCLRISFFIYILGTLTAAALIAYSYL